MLNNLQLKRMMPRLGLMAALGMLTVGALTACGNAAASPVPEPALSQERLVATAIAEALTAVAPTPTTPAAQPTRVDTSQRDATVSPASPPTPAPASDRGAAPKPTAIRATSTPGPAVILVTRNKPPPPTPTPTWTPNPTPTPLFANLEIDLNQFAPDPARGIWWEVTKEDMDRRELYQRIWIRPDESRQHHPYFWSESNTKIDSIVMKQIVETLQEHAIEFLDSQELEHDERGLLAQIGGSLRLEYASWEYPILRVQARFGGRKIWSTVSGTDVIRFDRFDPTKDAYLIGMVVAVDYNTPAYKHGSYLGSTTWGISQVIGSVLIEPSFYESR